MVFEIASSIQELHLFVSVSSQFRVIERLEENLAEITLQNDDDWEANLSNHLLRIHFPFCSVLITL